jgi:hypothetical protein
VIRQGHLDDGLSSAVAGVVDDGLAVAEEEALEVAHGVGEMYPLQGPAHGGIGGNLRAWQTRRFGDGA